MKTCSICGETKPIESFSSRPRNRDGRDGRCKACRAAYARNYRTPSKTRIWNLRQKLQLDEESLTQVHILAADPCSYCAGRGGTLDHIDAAGGNNWSNFTSSCASCNSAKGRKSVLLFLAQRNGHWREIPPGAVLSIREAA